jgi:zinc protease
MFYQAMQIGMAETVGLGWRSVEDYVKRIETVTPDQVLAVARKYLVEDRLNVAHLEPLPLPEGISLPDESPSTGGAHVR